MPWSNLLVAGRRQPQPWVASLGTSPKPRLRSPARFVHRLDFGSVRAQRKLDDFSKTFWAAVARGTGAEATRRTPSGNVASRGRAIMHPCLRSLRSPQRAWVGVGVSHPPDLLHPWAPAFACAHRPDPLPTRPPRRLCPVRPAPGPKGPMAATPARAWPSVCKGQRHAADDRPTSDGSHGIPPRPANARQCWRFGLLTAHGGPLQPGEKRVSMRVPDGASFARSLPAMNDVRDPPFCR